MAPYCPPDLPEEGSSQAQCLARKGAKGGRQPQSQAILQVLRLNPIPSAWGQSAQSLDLEGIESFRKDFHLSRICAVAARALAA